MSCQLLIPKAATRKFSMFANQLGLSHQSCQNLLILFEQTCNQFVKDPHINTVKILQKFESVLDTSGKTLINQKYASIKSSWERRNVQNAVVEFQIVEFTFAECIQLMKTMGACEEDVRCALRQPKEDINEVMQFIEGGAETAKKRKLNKNKIKKLKRQMKKKAANAIQRAWKRYVAAHRKTNWIKPNIPIEEVPRAVSEIEIPSQYLCPISLEIMKDPVLLTTGGVSFDRRCIQEWLSKKPVHPMTGETIDCTDLVPNGNLRELIEAWESNVGQPEKH